MEIDRAREIVSAVNARAFTTMGFENELPPLDEVSLVDMIEAKRVVQNVNEANQAAAKFSGGRYTSNVVPDDRLIAAVYCMDHYPCSHEPVLSIPHGAERQKVVAVLTIPNATPDDEED